MKLIMLMTISAVLMVNMIIEAIPTNIGSVLILLMLCYVTAEEMKRGS